MASVVYAGVVGSGREMISFPTVRRFRGAMIGGRAERAGGTAIRPGCAIGPPFSSKRVDQRLCFLRPLCSWWMGCDKPDTDAEGDRGRGDSQKWPSFSKDRRSCPASMVPELRNETSNPPFSPLLSIHRSRQPIQLFPLCSMRRDKACSLHQLLFNSSSSSLPVPHGTHLWERTYSFRFVWYASDAVSG